MDQMVYEILEDFWRDYLTQAKQVYQGLTCDGFDDDDDDEISLANFLSDFVVI